MRGIIDSARLNNELGSAGWDPIRSTHFARAKALASQHRGFLIKTIGDAVMAAFRNSVDALRFARELELDPGHGIVRLRVGVHVGQLEVKEGDAFGPEVNLAARICKQAEHGGIWVSDRVHGDWLTHDPAHSLPWTRHGKVRLRGFSELFTLWSLPPTKGEPQPELSAERQKAVAAAPAKPSKAKSTHCSPTPKPSHAPSAAPAQIHQTGSGSVAVGHGAMAAGKGGVVIGGNAHGILIITGNNNTVSASPPPPAQPEPRPIDPAILRAYLDWLIHDCAPLRLKAIDQGAARSGKEPLGLTSVYVDLNLDLRIAAEHSLAEHLEAEKRFRQTADRRLDRGPEMTECESKTRLVPVLEALALHEKLVLLGPPGSGKSTLIAYLALSLAQAASGDEAALRRFGQGWKHGPLLPVRVVLMPANQASPTSRKPISWPPFFHCSARAPTRRTWSWTTSRNGPASCSAKARADSSGATPFRTAPSRNTSPLATWPDTLQAGSAHRTG